MHIAVIGGGASGVLVSASLLADPSREVTVIEPREILGLGVAYSTAYPEHLLNVPAGRMSAFAGDPGHFAGWLSRIYGDRYQADSFVPRMVYGEYLRDVMASAARDAGSRFSHMRARAETISPTTSGVSITTSQNTCVIADAVVLALGNSKPAPWPGLGDASHDPRVFSSAWEPGALEPSSPNETVLLLGTGLTAIDAVLALRHHGHRGVIHMISRRGLRPHEHRIFDTPPAADVTAETMNDLFAAMRHAIEETKRTNNWRASVDRIRPRTNALWKAMTIDDQRRFVRHAMPYWNVHRHRMAPEVARTVDELLSAGQLRMIAGRTTRIAANSDGIYVGIRARGGNSDFTLCADRLINCSGPQHDVRRLNDPLIANMLAEGLLMPHPLGIGSQVSDDGALYDMSGMPSDRLFAMGPVRFGTLIETTAIPEIRQQAKDLAATLTASRRATSQEDSVAAR